MSAGSGPRRPPWCYRLVRDAGGQSETLGVLLLLGLTVVGTVGIVALGSTAMDDTERASAVQRAEHTMTLFDSRAAMVALGDADAQSVDFGGASDNDYTVRAETGWIKVEHINYTGSGHTEVVYNGTLGALVYSNGRTEIAYQGGGVWRSEGNGTGMVSPPEFHYRDATLTLPVVKVRGTATAAGDTRAVVTSSEQTHRIFPNTSGEDPAGDEVGNPYDDTSGRYLNPVENGTVNVTVHSAYYQGWAKFFRTRTDGEVTVHHNNDTVEVELVSKGTTGDFEMPAEGNSIDIRGVQEGHPIDDFTITLRPDDSDSADFSNLKWSLTVEEGSRQLEIHLRDSSGGNCGGDVRATVYYTEDGGSTYQGWTNGSAYQYECGDYNGDGDDEIRLVANLTSEAVDVTYDPISGGDGKIMVYSIGGGDSLISTATWDEHSGTVGWEPRDMGSCGGCDSTTTMHNTTNHYLGQFGSTYEIEIHDKNSDTVNEDASSGTLDYDSSDGKFITFLHITEDEITVEME